MTKTEVSIADRSDQWWYQELLELTKDSSDSLYDAPDSRSDTPGVPLSLALLFIQTILQLPKVSANFCYVSEWHEEWVNNPEYEDQFPAEAPDFPQQSVNFKSSFCRWFEIKHKFVEPTGLLFNLGNIATDITEGKISDFGSPEVINRVLKLRHTFDDR